MWLSVTEKATGTSGFINLDRLDGFSIVNTTEKDTNEIIVIQGGAKKTYFLHPHSEYHLRRYLAVQSIK